MITEPVRARGTAAAHRGEWRDSVSGETFETRNPATGELLATVAAANDRDVDEAIAAAWRAAPEWRRRGPRERAALLEQVAKRLEEEGDRLAYIDSANCGNPLDRMGFEPMTSSLKGKRRRKGT